MAEEKVGIEVEIDVDKAKQRLKEIKDQIAELKEQWGTAGKETLDKVLQPLLDEQESLEEQLKNVKEATDNVSKSFKKQASELNDVKDVTEFAGDATKALGVDETALGEAISNTTGYIGKSITFIKKGAAAMDAMKASTNNATGSVNKFKVALNGIAKHPILIALAAIAAGAAALYSRVKSLEDAKFDRYLGLIDRQAELLNEKLNNQITILNALGAKQSTVTRQQINNIKELNNQLKLSKDRYVDLWEAQGNDRITITAYAQQYLEGDMQYISKMSDEEQELVKRFAEAGEEIRKNNIELKTMENIILKINLAEESHELTLRKINLEREKGITSLQKEANAQGRAVQRYNMLAKMYERIFKYSDAKYEAELKAFKNEQAQSVTTIKMLNEEIQAIEEQKKANDELIATYLSTGASAKAQQLDVENEKLDINIQRLNEQIKSEKALIALRKEEKALNIVAEMNEAIRKMDLSKVDEAIQSFEYLIIKGMSSDSNKVDRRNLSIKELNRLVSYQNQVSDYFDKATQHIGNLSIEMANFVNDFDKQYTFLENRTGSFSERIKDEFNSIKETLESKDITEEQRALLTDRLTRLKNAYQEYNNISSQILNNIQGVTLSVFETVRNSSDTLIEFLNTNIGKGGELAFFDNKIAKRWINGPAVQQNEFLRRRISSGNEILTEYSKSLEDITKLYENVAEALRKYSNGAYTQEEITETLNENEKTLFENYKELGIPAYTELLNLVKELTNEYKGLSIAQKESSVNYAKSIYEYMQAYQSLGDYTLSEMERYANKVIDAESDYYEELYKSGGVYYDKLIEAGLTSLDAEQRLAIKRGRIEEELIDKKKLINQQYKQTILNATSDTMNDIQGIMDVAFEDNKQVRGATLMMTTLADAASAYTSVFAQAPGGVAAKTAQAVIASTAVMARGIASYNSLMNMTTSSGAESLSSANTMSNVTTATGVDTTSVARTLIGSRYAGEGNTTQYVLVTDEVTARQKQAAGARRLETI